LLNLRRDGTMHNVFVFIEDVAAQPFMFGSDRRRTKQVDNTQPRSLVSCNL